MNHKKNQMKNVATHHFCTSFYVALILVSSLLLNPVSVIAQTTQHITVKGQILDETKTPIIGASIVAEDTKTGTITDLEGYFSIRAIPNSTLSISYIGYTTQRVKASLKPIVITMTEDVAKLDEVVVVGYGQVKRANLTGAVTSVSMKELADYPAINLASVLNGVMPGVHVSEATGNPVGSASISVRINASWTGGDPLYVIDGFIRDVDAFNRLDPSEVESISVLKDASASVYGVRGRDGVILIKTKMGKLGKPKVSYAMSLGTVQGVEMPDMMSAYEQGVALNDYWSQQVTYCAADPTTKSYFSDAELEKMKTLNYNWLDMGWHNSYNTRQTLNVSGGTEDVKYFVGGSYLFSNGNFSNLSANRYGLRFGLDANITKQLKGTFSMDFTQKNTDQPLNSLDTESDRMYGTFSELVRTPRYTPAYINGVAVNTGGGINALEMLNSGSYRKSNTTDISSGVSLEYSVPNVTGLKITLTGNYRRTSAYGKQLSSPYYVYGFSKDDTFTHLYSSNQLALSDANYRKLISNGDKIYESASFSYSYQINPQISYAKKFGKHDLNTQLIYEQSESGGNGMSEGRQTVIIPNYEVMDGYSTTSQTTSSNISSLTRRQSVISRLNYNYDEKYFLEAATRLDASTLFADGYRWGAFPTVSAAWRISTEPFFEKLLPVIDEMKLRISVGRMGGDQATANQYRFAYQTNGTTLLGGGVATTNLKPQNSGLVYYNASWEKTDQYNVGLDMSIFHNLSVNIDAFYKRTFDILDQPKSTFAQSTGIGSSVTPSLNYGIQDARGGEIEIKYNKAINKDFSLQLKANIAYAVNFTIKKYQNTGVIGTWADENGKVSGGEVGYTCLGIARNQDDIDNYVAYLKENYAAAHDGATGDISVMGLSESDLKPGMLMYKDVGSAAYQDSDGNWHDGLPDGTITSDDQRTISKYSFAPFNYGYTIGFTWKSFKVDAMFTGSFGNDVFFEKGFWTTASGGGRTGAFLSETSNQLSEWYGNYWTEDNINAIYPRLDENSLRGYRSTFWMREGHQLQLKTINVSYVLSPKLSKKVGVDQCRVYCQASNIWTIINPYPYKDASVGFWSDYPMVRTINFGLNLSF